MCNILYILHVLKCKKLFLRIVYGIKNDFEWIGLSLKTVANMNNNTINYNERCESDNNY